MIRGRIARIVRYVVSAIVTGYSPLIVDVVVDAIRKVVVIEVFGVSSFEVIHTSDVVTRSIGIPKLAHDGRGQRIHLGLRNSVACEWSPHCASGGIEHRGVWIVNRPKPAIDVARLRKVALTLQRGGHGSHV